MDWVQVATRSGKLPYHLTGNIHNFGQNHKILLKYDENTFFLVYSLTFKNYS